MIKPSNNPSSISSVGSIKSVGSNNSVSSTIASVKPSVVESIVSTSDSDDSDESSKSSEVTKQEAAAVQVQQVDEDSSEEEEDIKDVEEVVEDEEESDDDEDDDEEDVNQNNSNNNRLCDVFKHELDNEDAMFTTDQPPIIPNTLDSSSSESFSPCCSDDAGLQEESSTGLRATDADAISLPRSSIATSNSSRDGDSDGVAVASDDLKHPQSPLGDSTQALLINKETAESDSVSDESKVKPRTITTKRMNLFSSSSSEEGEHLFSFPTKYHSSSSSSSSETNQQIGNVATVQETQSSSDSLDDDDDEEDLFSSVPVMKRVGNTNAVKKPSLPILQDKAISKAHNVERNLFADSSDTDEDLFSSLPTSKAIVNNREHQVDYSENLDGVIEHCSDSSVSSTSSTSSEDVDALFSSAIKSPKAVPTPRGEDIFSVVPALRSLGEGDTTTSHRVSSQPTIIKQKVVTSSDAKKKKGTRSIFSDNESDEEITKIKGNLIYIIVIILIIIFIKRILFSVPFSSL